MSQLFIFYEHAMGCALFKVPDYEEGDEFISKIKENVLDLSKFSELVELVTFQPFASGREALEYQNNSSEGVLLESIQQFLENNLPKSKKKRPVVLGVAEAKLATAISEALGITCSINKEVSEVSRGIRLHFDDLFKGIKDRNTACKSQLALGHSYARAKVKFNVNRIDNMVIQSISLIDQLDKDINTFSMRVREWYSFHFPELVKVVPENPLFIKCVSVIKNRKEMPEDIREQLENILMDSAKAENILELARSSMGMDISPLDMENIVVFATRVNSLMNRRKELVEYLRTKMHNVAPNLAALIGDMVGARLIAHAGSLINLAKFPASTVQILGAEKALFRAIKTRGNTPKYGLIYHSSFIGRAGKTNKGRISRYLANKCSVATRIDCFREIPTEVFGSKLKQQVEDRLKFYETGDIPAKNVDVMVEALGEADIASIEIAKQRKKADKKEKKRRSQMLAELSSVSLPDLSLTEQNDDDANEENKSEKKKKRKKESMEESDMMEKSPKKMKLNQDETQEVTESSEINAEGEMDITDPEVLKQIRKAKKKEKKRLKALQMAAANGDDSALTSDGSMLNNTSIFTTDTSMDCSMNVSTDGPVNDLVENGSINKKKKKKKKKNKHQEE